MSTDFAVAPDESNTVTGAVGAFAYGVYWPDSAAWSADALFRLEFEDKSEHRDFMKGEGTVAGSCVVFTFEDAQPGIRYRGLLVDGDITLSLFACADLCALQHSADPACFLPFPDPEDQITATTAADTSGDDGSDSSDGSADSQNDNDSSSDDSTDGPSGDDDGGDAMRHAVAYAAITPPTTALSASPFV